jgi:hypothetical protein
VIDVKPGYARNYLVPNKKVVYATRPNFVKHNIVDPATTTGPVVVSDDDKNLRGADLLRHYFRNKTV